MTSSVSDAALPLSMVRPIQGGATPEFTIFRGIGPMGIISQVK
jgi:hypothetical protein